MLNTKLDYYLNHEKKEDINHVIAKFMKDHMSEIPEMNIEQVAKECYASPAKISNFSKKLGYESFIQLKDECREDLHTMAHMVNRYTEDPLDYFPLASSYIAKIDRAQIKKLAEELCRPEYIFCCAVEYGRILEEFFQFQMDHLNRRVVIMNENDPKHYEIKPEHIVIAISIDGGAAAENYQYWHSVSSYPASKWLIATDRISKDVVQKFDHHILMPYPGQDYRIATVELRCFFEVLFDECLKYDRNSKRP